MCLSVYLASNHDLSLVPWNEEKPSFYVSDLEYDKGVRKQFSLPNVRFIGSDAGCGCGFLKDGVVGQELVEAMANYVGLATYIKDVQSDGALIEIFACWAGDQEKERDSSESIRSADLLEEGFEFKERTLYAVEAV